MAPAKITTPSSPALPVQSNGISKPVETGMLAPAASPLGTEAYLEYEERYVTRGLPSLPVVISKAEGARLWDAEGREYIDFLAGFSVVNQGHCHPRITRVMIEQCQKVTLAGRAYHNDQYPVLCKKVCEMFGFDKASSMNSGSEAVDLAVKIARKWGYVVKGIPPNEALVLTCTGNYHGKTLSPLSASDDQDSRNDYGPFMPGVGPFCASRPVRFDHIEDLEAVLEADGARIAAFLVECVQGYAGCKVPTEGYIKAARNLCKKHNVLFIADEIQCGLGRTGHLMAYQREGIHPDMVVLGKALTGGVYPMGMVLGMRETMSQLLTGENSSTFAGSPLGSAVAMAALDVLVDEKLPDRAARLGPLIWERLGRIKSPHLLGFSGRGLFYAVYLDQSHPSGRVTARRLALLLKQRGVLAYSAANRLRLAPPLMIPEKDLWMGFDLIETALNDLPHIEHIDGEEY